MAVFEVQGIVSSNDGQPYVQVRSVEDDGTESAGFQFPVLEAREVAQNIIEAAANATYEAALIAWAKDRDPVNGEAMGIMMVDAVRRYRSDKWGLPSMPVDWRNDGSASESE